MSSSFSNSTSRREVALGLVMLGLIVAAPQGAGAAQRVVLGEYFTNIY